MEASPHHHHDLLAATSHDNWWAMGHQALAMEMEHLGRLWQLRYFSIASHRFGSTVRRVYASVFAFPYFCQIPILTCSDMSSTDSSVQASGRERGPTRWTCAA